MREGELGSKLSTHLRQQNAIVIPMVVAKHGGAVHSMRGVADKYICHTYWRGWMELKAAGETLTQEQLDFARMMVQRGDQACGVQFNSKEWFGVATELIVWLFNINGSYREFSTHVSHLLLHLQVMQDEYPYGMYDKPLSEYPVSKAKKK